MHCLRYQLNLQAPTVAGVAMDMRADDINASTAGVAVSDGVFFTYGDAGKLLGEYALDGSPLQETLYLGDQPVAVLKDGVIYAVHTDHLGTPRAITDPANTVVWRWDSDPFGTTLPQEGTGADGQPFAYNLRFPGQYYDSETGLHYNYFRDYDPTTGRYVQSDPIGVLRYTPDPMFSEYGSALTQKDLLDGLNHPYAYTEGNPLYWIDPDGLAEEHKTNQRESNRNKHEKGQSRKDQDRGGEKADKNRAPPRTRPPGHKGPWPPIPGIPILICPLCPYLFPPPDQPPNC